MCGFILTGGKSKVNTVVQRSCQKVRPRQPFPASSWKLASSLSMFTDNKQLKRG